MADLKSLPSRRSRVLLIGLCALSTGCALVPRSRLDECHQFSKTLEAEKTRLKSEVLSMRSKHLDLAQRADDDARRVQVLEDENRRLLASVQAYQDERDQLAADFSKLKEQLQVAANPVATSFLNRFETFVKGRPGCDFDPSTGVLTLASDPLFKPGTDQLKPQAQALLASVAELLGAPEAGGVRLLVAGHTDDSGVERTAFQAEKPTDTHLSLDRAIRVRDCLAREARIDRDRLEVAGFEASQPRSDGTDERARALNRRIEIRLLGGSAPPAGAAAGP